MKNKIYEEVSTTYRFFLGWRHASFAAVLVILWAVASICISAHNKELSFVWVIPLAASPIGILLWVIDTRTRDIYHAAIDAGKGLEAPERGFFTILSERVAIPRGRRRLRSHSTAISVLFLGSSLLLLASSVLIVAFS